MSSGLKLFLHRFISTFIPTHRRRRRPSGLPLPTEGAQLVRSVGIAALTLGYLAVMAATSGIRAEELVAVSFIFILLAINARTRDFAIRGFPLALYGIVYDLTHLTEPLVRRLHVHVAALQRVELALFGIPSSRGRITLNQFFAVHHWPWLDLITGSAYLIFLYWALAFGMFLVWTGRTGERRRLATGFTWAFLGLNVAGFATYYLYPSAPPWYVAQYGLGPANFAAQASPAAAIRWDQLTGLHYFQSFYGKSADVFGALPSLHAAQPFLVYLYGRHLRRRWLNAVQGGFFLLVCFSAIYLQHHYVVDVLAGIVYALAAYGIERTMTATHTSRATVSQFTPVSEALETRGQA